MFQRESNNLVIQSLFVYIEDVIWWLVLKQFNFSVLYRLEFRFIKRGFCIGGFGIFKEILLGCMESDMIEKLEINFFYIGKLLLFGVVVLLMILVLWSLQ